MPCSRSQEIISSCPSGVLGRDSPIRRGRINPSTFAFETSMPTILPSCVILRLPSLLVRALSPLQLFGLKEDTGPVPRSPSGFASGFHGLRSSDGRLFWQPPVRIVSPIFGTQGFHGLRSSDGRLFWQPPVRIVSPIFGTQGFRC